MAKVEKFDYEVIRRWAGVEVGDIVQLAEPINPVLRANVRKLGAVKVTEADKVLAAAKAEAAELIKTATAQAEKIVGEAHAQAANPKK